MFFVSYRVTIFFFFRESDVYQSQRTQFVYSVSTKRLFCSGHCNIMFGAIVGRRCRRLFVIFILYCRTSDGPAGNNTIKGFSIRTVIGYPFSAVAILFQKSVWPVRASTNSIATD